MHAANGTRGHSFCVWRAIESQRGVKGYRRDRLLTPCEWPYYSMGQLASISGDAATNCACFLSALGVAKIAETCRRGHSWSRDSILWRQLFLQNMIGGKGSFIDCGIDWRREYKDDFCWMTGEVVIEDCIPRTGTDSDLTDMVTSVVQLHKNRYFCGGHDGRVVEFDKNNCTDEQSTWLNNVFVTNEWIRSMTSVREDTLALCVGNDLLYVRIEQAEALSAEMFSTLKGHTGPVHFTAPYNDTMCVSTSFDRTARLWDLPQGVCTGVFHGHTEQLYGVMCSAPYIVTASYDRSVRLFDNRDKCNGAQCTFQGHNGPAWFVQPCTEADLLSLTRFYSSSSDGIVREWDIRSPSRPSHIFPSMSCSSCNDFIVDHGHKRLVCGYDDGSVSVFSTTVAKERIHHDLMSARYIRKVGSFQSSARPRHKYFFGDSNGQISLVGSTESVVDLPKPSTFQKACDVHELSGIRSMLCCEQENSVFYGTYDGHVKRLTVAHGGMQKS